MAFFLGLSDELTFGKYKDRQYTLRDAIDDDVDYVKYCLEKEIITMDEEAENYWESAKYGV
jgi:hypothetical protein